MTKINAGTNVYRFWDPDPFSEFSAAEAFEKAGARVGFDDDTDELIVRDLPLKSALEIAGTWQLVRVPDAPGNC